MIVACSPKVDEAAETDIGTTEAADASSTGDMPIEGLRPFRDAWRTVIDQPFSTYDVSGAVAISSLVIGDQGNDNFNNRGDVIVQYAETDRIVVEMRSFTMVDSQVLADADFAALEIRASTAPVPPPPYENDPVSDCVDPQGQKPWRDGCQIAVFYDGVTQPSRTGADLRVTLPRDFIYDLVIVTEDNDADTDYLNRGNVCVEGLPGSVDIQLSNGSAWVILEEGMPEMPECPGDLRSACEADAWDPVTCGCLSQGYAFSQVKVVSNDGQSSDATVDVPSGDFWVGYNMRNDGGAPCEAFVDDDVGTVLLAAGTDLDGAPWSNQGTINYPGEPATLGAGYSVQLVSDTCTSVLSTENPDDFGGQGGGPDQVAAQRGNLRICLGCARSLGCDALVPE